tara:strand:+ start:4411 stop:4554 length:144 start_codon:yes stop_codon:yes gene_type:complete
MVYTLTFLVFAFFPLAYSYAGFGIDVVIFTSSAIGAMLGFRFSAVPA